MLELNEDQQKAAEAFTAFMVSEDKEMVISGGAGVGKTTLLKYLMELKTPAFICGLLGKKPIQDWALTATTNKAAEVLAEATGMEAKTIHSFLGLRVSTDYETGAQKVVRKDTTAIVYDTLIIVDECSMVDTPLRKHINELTMNCKILYVGDHCQMAPVTEAISPVFANNEPIVLNTIIRAANAPPIMELCQKLRNTVETGQFFDIEPSPGFIDFLDTEQAEAEINRTFLADAHANARILCYTNSKAIRFNEHLRNERGLPQQFTDDEWVVSNSVARVLNGGPKDPMLRIEEEVQIFAVSEPYQETFYLAGDAYGIMLYNVATNRGTYKVPTDAQQFREILKEIANRAKKNSSLWSTYYRLKEEIADLRPRDACTVYKSQGSTYHTVFIDLNDIGQCRNPSQAARMLYVACSRPTHRICFLGQLPNRFRGL